MMKVESRSLIEQVSKYCESIEEEEDVVDWGWIMADVKIAPLLEDVNINFLEKTFNGSLFKANDFRQSAGPVVDAAWESLGVDCTFLHAPHIYFLSQNPSEIIISDLKFYIAIASHSFQQPY